MGQQERKSMEQKKIRYFDTHCHMDDERFNDDRDLLLRGLPGKGVTRIVWPGTDIPSSRMAKAYAEKFDFISFAAGVHPHEAEKEQPLLGELPALLQGACAVGEIGLDYHYDFSPRPVQKEVFAAQLDIAVEKKLPVILHEREAAKDMMDMLSAYRGRLTGVMHSCAASPEDARRLLDWGFYLSFNGLVTFAKVKRPLEVIALCPHNRLMLETDSPYMTPVPHRGKRNDPSFTPFVAAKVAEIWGMPQEECAEITYQNGLACFGLAE